MYPFILFRSLFSFLLLFFFFFLMIRRPPRSTLFPYTTSSDLPRGLLEAGVPRCAQSSILGADQTDVVLLGDCRRDRKSTRLNSSHGYISYAVFCLKKKKNYSFRSDT